MLRKRIRYMVHGDSCWSSALCIDGSCLILSMQSLHTQFSLSCSYVFLVRFSGYHGEGSTIVLCI